ncbi:MAG: hypothetical protein IKP00_04870 [Victivallales bacterium]|nr:hypothetical protein [Victivallales bacterium]
MSIGKPVERDAHGVLSDCDDGVCSVGFDEQECIDISSVVYFSTDLLAPSITMHFPRENPRKCPFFREKGQKRSEV